MESQLKTLKRHRYSYHWGVGGYHATSNQSLLLTEQDCCTGFTRAGALYIQTTPTPEQPLAIFKLLPSSEPLAITR